MGNLGIGGVDPTLGQGQPAGDYPAVAKLYVRLMGNFGPDAFDYGARHLGKGRTGIGEGFNVRAPEGAVDS